jgi:Abnormal spindle-like microcephaly-assoc'd, ASPM-SPD-2-Hydin
MRRLFSAMLVLLGAASAATAQVAAQDLQLSDYSASSDTYQNFSGVYTFPDTAAGGSSSVTFRLVNTSATNAYLVLAINFSPGSAFSTEGTTLGVTCAPVGCSTTPVYEQCLAPGGTNEDFAVVFSPAAVSSYQDNLQISYVQFPAAQGCSGTVPNVTPVNFGMFYGTGSQPLIAPGGGGQGALTFTYVDASGVSHALTAGATVNFGNVQIGSTQSFTFTLANPSTAAGPVSVPQISVSSGSFQILNALSAQDSIQPGSSASFQVAFEPTASATPAFTGTLSISTQSVNLKGTGTSQPFPTPTLNVTTGAVENQQQDYISVILPSAAPYQATDYLTLSFTPSVTGIATDPAVLFLQGSLNTVPVYFTQGAESGTVNNQTAIGFQTGTTAGTLTFTLCTMAASPCSAADTLATQSYTIAPQVVQIATVAAVTDDPNLVVTLTGYDNTYSAGKLTFTFYDSNGKNLTPGGIAVDATSEFSQYFFSSGNGYGGAFAMQASFPVSGTFTQTVQGTTSTTWAGTDIYSVTVTLENAAGASLPQTILFQTSN